MVAVAQNLKIGAIQPSVWRDGDRRDMIYVGTFHDLAEFLALDA
jgi:hypothetical protein